MSNLMQLLAAAKHSNPVLPDLKISGTYIELILDNLNALQKKWEYKHSDWRGWSTLNQYFPYLVNPNNQNELNSNLDYLVTDEFNNFNTFCNKQGSAHISGGGIDGDRENLFQEACDLLNLKLMVEFDNYNSLTYKGAKLRYYAIDYLDNLDAKGAYGLGKANNPFEALLELIKESD